MMNSDAIRESIRYCRDVTKKSATSFYYAFKTLPKAKRIGFEVVYAFMRLSDDLSDDAEVDDRAASMRRWRDMLHTALAGDTSVHPVMPALVQVIEDFQIPVRYLDELLEGTESDLYVTRFETFEELRVYCYKVASTVGLVSLRLFGLDDTSEENWQRAEKMAIDCGLGFQLTNILRDIKEDIERDRIYVPLEDLKRFELTADDLRQGITDERFRSFMIFEVDRAQSFYDRSADLVPLLEPNARASLLTMRGIYHGILQRIVEQDYDVYSRRARLSLPRKLSIAARAYFNRFSPSS